jgi:hypothetical protein
VRAAKILEPTSRIIDLWQIVRSASLKQQHIYGRVFGEAWATTEPEEPDPQTMKS